MEFHDDTDQPDATAAGGTDYDLSGRYIREIFHVFTVTKLTDEGYFNNDFAIVSSAEDAF